VSEIERLRERVERVRSEYAALPRDGWGELGAPDERTGERWDRGHVLGHVAEMLPYWIAQVQTVLEGSALIGRDEAGSARRRRGIDTGRDEGEEGLLRSVDAGMEGLLALLAGMRDADLERRVMRHLPEGEEEADLGTQIEDLLVGHAERHLRQLRELGAVSG